jgi:fatty-acid peroxygenase
VTDDIPRLEAVDSSVALLREGYAFGAHRFARFSSDAFETRLMFRRAVVAFGEEAARLVYEPDRMTRRRALPPTTLTLLLDLGSVDLLDGEAHRHRKRMFMSMMTPAALDEIGDLVEREWRDRIPEWARAGEVVLLDAVRDVLCRAVCAWAGVPIEPGRVGTLTRQLAAMVEGAASVGPRNARGQLLRHRAERWAGDVITRVRSGDLAVEEGRALHVVAWHRDEEGRLLDTEVARVELLNVLRPTVAVARFVVFAALALHQHPEWRAQVSDEHHLRWFVREVRRYHPFFPMVGGRVQEPFDWRGRFFPRGSWFLLDIYATNHDPRIWTDPAAFQPERFATWDGNPYAFVPQGGGDFDTGHRCAGEWLTISVMERAVRLLTSGMTYDVPLQDLTVDLARMPAAPASGVRLTGIRPA